MTPKERKAVADALDALQPFAEAVVKIRFAVGEPNDDCLIHAHAPPYRVYRKAAEAFQGLRAIYERKHR